MILSIAYVSFFYLITSQSSPQHKSPQHLLRALLLYSVNVIASSPIAVALGEALRKFDFRKQSFRVSLYSIISVTTPDPTVLPPSRIANLNPSSIAIGVISFTSMTMLSPGMHISVPSGSCKSPVTSVVLK